MAEPEAEAVTERMADRPLQNVMEPGWAEALKPWPGRSRRWATSSGRNSPPGAVTCRRENVLRAFKQPFAEVRVLIVGQDPYPTPGHPIGLSFSVRRMCGRCRAAWATSTGRYTRTSAARTVER